MEKIECTYGFKILNDKGQVIGYETGSTFNGQCFKDNSAYESGKGVCYISEYEFEDFENDCDNLKELLNNGELTQSEQEQDVMELCDSVGWKRKDILDLTDNNSFVADIVFSGVNWQTCETYYNECDDEDFEEYSK